MKVLKTPLARKVFADLASQGRLSEFVASTSTMTPQSEPKREYFELTRALGNGKVITRVTTRVISRNQEEEASTA